MAVSGKAEGERGSASAHQGANVPRTARARASSHTLRVARCVPLPHRARKFPSVSSASSSSSASACGGVGTALPFPAAAMDDIEMAVKVELTVAGCPQRGLYDLRAAVPLAEHVGALPHLLPGASSPRPRRGRRRRRAGPGSALNNFGLWVPMHGRFLADEEWETARAPLLGSRARRCSSRRRRRAPRAALYTLKRGEEGREGGVLGCAPRWTCSSPRSLSTRAAWSS